MTYKWLNASNLMVTKHLTLENNTFRCAKTFDANYDYLSTTQATLDNTSMDQLSMSTKTINNHKQYKTTTQTTKHHKHHHTHHSTTHHHNHPAQYKHTQYKQTRAQWKHLRAQAATMDQNLIPLQTSKAT